MAIGVLIYIRNIGLNQLVKVGDNPLNWSSVNGLHNRLQNAERSLAVARQRIAELTRVIGQKSLGLFPFAIYRPSYLLSGNPDIDSAWRTFRVRSGRVGQLERGH